MKKWVKQHSLTPLKNVYINWPPYPVLSWNYLHTW